MDDFNLMLEQIIDDLDDGFTCEDYTNLLTTAKEFSKLKPWTWMSEDQIFIVKDETTQRLGFCSIMGQFGKQFSLMVFEGIEGYEAYEKLASFPSTDLTDPFFMKAYFNQCATSVSFENRDDLATEDYDLIKDAGFSFRGKKQWPTFRKYEKGLPVELLTETDDVEFLTLCLEIAIQVAKSTKLKHLNVLDNGSDFLMVTVKADGTIEEETISITSLTQKVVLPYKNDVMIHKLKKLPQKRRVLEGVQFYMPMPILDQEGLVYYPAIYTMMEKESGIIFDPCIGECADLEPAKICNWLADILLKLKERPIKILVEDDLLKEILSDFCHQLSITCEVSDDLVMAKEFVNMMFNEALNHDLTEYGNDLFGEFDEDDLFADDEDDLFGEFDEDDDEEFETLFKNNDQMRGVVRRLSYIMENYGSSMNPDARELFVPQILLTIEMMFDVFGDSEQEWQAKDLEILIKDYYKKAMSKYEYNQVALNICNYISLTHEEAQIKNANEIIKKLTRTFKVNKNWLFTK